MTYKLPEPEYLGWDYERLLVKPIKGYTEAQMQQAYQAGEKAWKDAVIDQLVTLHIYQAKHDADPRLALNDAIDYHVQIALDPQVSSDAAALVQRGRDAMREEAVKVCVATAGRYNDDYAAGAKDSAKAIKELK